MYPIYRPSPPYLIPSLVHHNTLSRALRYRAVRYNRALIVSYSELERVISFLSKDVAHSRGLRVPGFSRCDADPLLVVSSFGESGQPHGSDHTLRIAGMLSVHGSARWHKQSTSMSAHVLSPLP